MSLTLPKPAALHGERLADELVAAGFADAEVSDNGRGDIEVSGVSESDRDAVQAVVDAHAPPAPEPDPDDEFRAAVEAATSIADLKAALLGTTGPGAEPRRLTR